MTDNTKLLQSLVGYFNDVKPYHSKLNDLTSELFFNEELIHVNVQEKQFTEVMMQGIWDAADRGGESLVRIMTGDASDLTFNIPWAIFPRFSLNDSLNFGQTPHGHDPATSDLTDLNTNGIPDSEQTWTGDQSSSHFNGDDEIAVAARVSDLRVEITQSFLNGTVYEYEYSIHFTIDAAEAIAFGFQDSAVKVFVGETEYLTFTRLGSNFSVDGLTGTYTIPNNEVAMVPGGLDSSFYSLFAAYRQLQPVSVYWQDTRRYRVPHHQGCRVRVDGVAAVFQTDFVVDRSRSFIQFLPNSILGNSGYDAKKIDVNLFKADRLFLRFLSPFDFGVTRNFDEGGYDDLSYDNEDENPDTDDADRFTITVVDASDETSTVTFYNSIADASLRKGSLTVRNIYNTSADGDVWEVTAIGPWKFQVQQTVPALGPLYYASFKIPFDNGKIAFTIDGDWTPYYLLTDPGSYAGLLGQAHDVSDFLVNLDLKTQHGVLTDPVPSNHAPMQLIQFGKIKKAVNEHGEYYTFVLDNIPKKNTYVELRIEQNAQYNPHVSVTATDFLSIVQILQAEEEIEVQGLYSPTKNFHHLLLPGTDGNHVTSPTGRRHDVTGDIQISAHLKLDDWTPGTDQTIISKYETGQLSYKMYITTTGRIGFKWSPDNVAEHSFTSDLLSFANNSTHWVRVSLENDASGVGGTLKFYKSEDGSLWDLIGSPTLGAINSSIYKSTARVAIGVSHVNTDKLAGKVYQVDVRGSISDEDEIYLMDGADFDGTVYMKSNDPIPGSVDSKLGTFVAWVRLDGSLIGPGTQQNVFSAADTPGSSTPKGLQLSYASSRWTVRAFNTAGTVILNVSTPATYNSGAAWLCIMGSFDLSDTAKRKLYVGDDSELSLITTYTDDTIDYTVNDWVIGARSDGQNTFNGAIGELLFWPNVYYDWGIEANRRKVITEDGKPVSPFKLKGLIADLSTPVIHLHLDEGEAPANYRLNHGREGDFFITGSLTNASTSPSDGWGANFNALDLRPGAASGVSQKTGTTWTVNTSGSPAAEIIQERVGEWAYESEKFVQTGSLMQADYMQADYAIVDNVDPALVTTE